MTHEPDDPSPRPDAEPVEPPSAFDLPDAEFEQFQAEVHRILGASADESAERPSRQMFWLLPAPTFAEAMALLREVPSGSGEAGLHRLVAERFPELAEPDTDDWADDP
jgi:hypothetical protein